jgi:hypothetical protein
MTGSSRAHAPDIPITGEFIAARRPLHSRIPDYYLIHDALNTYCRRNATLFHALLLLLRP